MSVRSRHGLTRTRYFIQDLLDIRSICLDVVLQRYEHTLAYAVFQNIGILQQPSADHLGIVAGAQCQRQLLGRNLVCVILNIEVNAGILPQLVNHVPLSCGRRVINEYCAGNLLSVCYDRKSFLIPLAVYNAVLIDFVVFRAVLLCRSIAACAGTAAFAAAAAASKHTCRHNAA